MANTFTQTKIIDGPRTVVIHAYLESDGLAGEITDGVLVDVSTLSPVPDHLVVQQIDADITGFSAKLEFDATADVPFYNISPDTSLSACWHETGGVPDPKGAGYTGDILITTSGFTAAGDRGYVRIECVKSWA